MDARKAATAEYLDKVGFYDPRSNPVTLTVDVEKAKDWLSKGVQPTETVKSLLVASGAMEKSDKLSPRQDEDEEKEVSCAAAAAFAHKEEAPCWNLIKYIVEQFAEEKDAISYDVEETEDTITVTVLLAESDMGKVIGKQGKIAKALRTLVRAATPQGQQEVQRGDQGTPFGVSPLFERLALRMHCRRASLFCC